MSSYLEPPLEGKRLMGLILGVEPLRAKVRGYFHDLVYEIKIMSYDINLLNKSLLKYKIKDSI